MPLLKAGVDWIECMELDGLLITAITDDKLAEVVVPPTLNFSIHGVIVDVHPAVEVIPMDTEYYYDDYKGCWEHFFDAFLTDEPGTLYASVSGGQILHIQRLL